MSEPITLYRDGAIVTVYAPSVARELQAAGWVTEPDADSSEVPFSFREAEPEPETDVDIVPVKAKRGRPKKVTQ